MTSSIFIGDFQFHKTWRFNDPKIHLAFSDNYISCGQVLKRQQQKALETKDRGIKRQKCSFTCGNRERKKINQTHRARRQLSEIPLQCKFSQTRLCGMLERGFIQCGNYISKKKSKSLLIMQWLLQKSICFSKCAWIQRIKQEESRDMETRTRNK